MNTTAGKTHIEGCEETEQTFKKKRGWFLFFPVEWYEKVNERHIANDISIITSREIRQVYLNGNPLLKEHPLN